MPSERHRNYCFTLNNPLNEEILQLSTIVSQQSEYVRYICWGFERGEQGTEHLQGYIEFKNPRSIKWVKSKVNKRFHLEARRGTQREAIIYCQKDGRFYEFGERAKQGQRGDLDQIRSDALEYGMQYVVEYANLQQMRVAEKVRIC